MFLWPLVWSLLVAEYSKWFLKFSFEPPYYFNFYYFVMVCIVILLRCFCSPVLYHNLFPPILVFACCYSSHNYWCGLCVTFDLNCFYVNKFNPEWINTISGISLFPFTFILNVNRIWVLMHIFLCTSILLKFLQTKRHLLWWNVAHLCCLFCFIHEGFCVK